MALVVEDGSGLSNATSLISVAFADSYHRARGNTAWGNLSASVKESLCLKATEYLASEYYFMGEKAKPDQALPFPRLDMYDEDARTIPSDSVPLGIQRATAEAALALSTNTDLSASPVVTSGNVHRRRERIGVIESETEGNVDTSVRFYPRVHQLVLPFVIGKRSGGSTPNLRG